MLVPIVIDVSDLASEFSMSDKDVEMMIDSAVKAASLRAYELWNQQAGQNLKSTRARYQNSLVLVDEGMMKGAVVLRDDDPLVMMIEDGASEFDMKEGFAKSSRRTVTEDGWYMTIPFRHAAATSLGESEVFSGVLPQEIYSKIQSADTPISMGGGSRSEGMKLEDIPKQYQESTVRPAIPDSKLLAARKEYLSRSSKYEGLVKMKDGATGQTSGYVTFRRVSSNSAPESWIHKGFESRNFAEKTESQISGEIEGLVDVQIDNFLNSYVNG